MPRKNDKRYEQIRELFTRLDLCYHSLKLVGEELISESSGSSVHSSSVLGEKAVQLSKECSKVIREMYGRLDAQELDLSESALNRVELAIRRASESRTHTLQAVHIWRVIEAADRYLANVSPKYGYVRLSRKMALEAVEKHKKQNAQLAQLFREYKEAMATGEVSGKPAPAPFSHGILRWRGSQLYYGERIGDGVRWIELDPDYEVESVDDDEEGVELVEAKTIEGHLIKLRLDTVVDEVEVDTYLGQQKLSPYIVTGAQIAREQKRGSRRKRRRR